MTRRIAAWPWWAHVLAVYLSARAVSATLLLVMARTQAETVWAPASPTYQQVTGLFWDASWYRQIAVDGYPAALPLGEDGRVLQNAWAFFPLFPSTARQVMRLTGWEWEIVGPTLALVLGTLAALVLHRVMTEAMAGPAASPLAPAVRAGVPLTTVALVALAPAAPTLQVAYTESTALLLVLCFVWALQRGQYLLAVPVAAGVGLSRAVALPLAVAVASHGVALARRRLAGGQRLLGRELAPPAGLLVVTVGAGFLWPAVVGWRTGVPDAYALTQGAWRARGEVVPLLPWWDVAVWKVGPWAPALLALVLVVVVGLLVSRPLRRSGPELWGWTAGYLGYLLVVVEPGTSLVRFALLAFPVAGVLAQVALGSRRPRAAVTGVLVLALLSQVAWVALVWRLVPPSGWPP